MIIQTLCKREALFSAVMFIIVFSFSVYAQPQLPSILYGKASINGRDAPVGSVLTAKVNGLVKGSFTLTSEGYYDQINVDQANPGDEIEFYLQTPSMSNTLKAEETGTWASGKVTELNLTFSGDEIPKTSGSDGSGGGSGGGGSGGGSSSGTGEEPEEPEAPSEPEIQGNIYNLDGDFAESNEASVTLSRGDEVTFDLKGETQSIKAKSLSEFGILLTINVADEIVDLEETRNFDLNGDGIEDISVSLTKVEDNQAHLTFAKLEQIPQRADFTGMITTLLSNFMGLLLIVFVIGGGYYLYRRK
jgi:hypothetical protein